MFERFTAQSIQALFLARAIAAQAKAAAVEPEHLLVGIALLDPPPPSIAAARTIILLHLGIDASRPPQPRPKTEVVLSSELQQLLNHATVEADQLKQNRVHPEHLLVALLDHTTNLADLLRKATVEKTELIEQTKRLAALGDEPVAGLTVKRQIRIK
jgi:ATP-dependent Clp protease ATP-binding subunit ClpA